MTRPYNNQHKNKQNLQNCRLSVPADRRIKLKEREKKDQYLDIAWELNTQWNMKVTIIPNVIGVLGAVTKGLLMGLKDLEVGGEWRPSKLLYYCEQPEY